MPRNLFELIDGLFRGVVYFIYNWFETAYRPLRNPRTGPARLFRDHSRADQRQIGALTFLFTCFFVAYLLFSWLFLSELAAIWTVQAENALHGEIHRSLWWPVFVSAIVSTVTLDAILRLALFFSQPGRARRQRLLAMAEYAMLLPAALVVVPMAVTIIHLLGSLSEGWPDGEDLGNVVALGSVAAVSAVPALFQFWPGDGLRAPIGRQGAFAGSVAAVLRWAWLTLIILLSSLAGVLVGTFMFIEEYSKLGRVEIVSLRCHLAEPRPSVDVLLTNPSAERQVADLHETRLSIGRFSYDGQFSEWDARPGNVELPLSSGRDGERSEAVVLEPGETKMVRAWVTKPGPIRTARWAECRLLDFYTPADGSPGVITAARSG